VTVVYAHAADAAAVERLSAAVQMANPGYVVGSARCDGDLPLAPSGGARYAWLAAGSAEVYLPAGYRTQEGDGAVLPETYAVDPLPGVAAVHLEALSRALEAGTVDRRVLPAVESICGRIGGGDFRGNIAGDVWTLLESGVPASEWTSSAAVRSALGWLVERFEHLGWSTKQSGGWEPVLPGDLLVATGNQPLRARGSGILWWIEDLDPSTGEASRVRRLRYLRDTAGGCSPGFDAFRRLALTWRPPPAQRAAVLAQLAGSPGPHDGAAASGGASAAAARSGANGRLLQSGASDADRPNRINFHVLHIEAGQSRTHYHPESPVGGGRPQSEFYFGLDPSAYELQAPPGAVPRLYTFPRIDDWVTYDTWEVEPGVAVFIPPGTGHRGVDAFVNVVTIPGFKPGNEIYVDRRIAESGSGAPFNAAAAQAA
jgi:hypothetical protein